jgi:shikimate dehydrogenase
MAASIVTFSGKTKYLGLLGDPIEQVRTPTIFREFCESRGIDAAYVPMQVSSENFGAVVAALHCLGNFCGFGVTIPHKPAAAGVCDELLPNARACGVVNHIRVEPDGRWVGEALDGVGMVRGIGTKRRIDANSNVLVLGAGGTGRQIAVALALAGAGRICIANRTVGKAQELAETVRSATPSCEVSYSVEVDPAPFDIVINATSLGLNGQGPLPVDVSRLAPNALVAEVVMTPAVTPLLEQAQERSLASVPGRAMLDQQLEAIVEFLGLAKASPSSP